MKAIVGIEIEVSSLTGKWKMSQNRQRRDIDGVIQGLRSMQDPASTAIADEVERRRPR
jgi:transcriptional regulator